MTNWKTQGNMVFGLFAALALIAAGCGDSPKAGVAKEKDKGKTVAKAEAKHSGWWCDEHGLPEAECRLLGFRRKRVQGQGRLVRQARPGQEPVLPLRSEAQRQVRGTIQGQVRKRAAADGRRREGQEG